MMSEKRFKKMDTIIDPFPIWDTVEEKGYNCTDTLDVLVDLLNEQQATIQQLQAKLREKEEDEQLYANEIVKLNKEAKEVLDFKSLGGDY